LAGFIETALELRGIFKRPEPGCSRRRSKATRMLRTGSAFLYMQGQGMDADDAQAAIWISKAAEQGDGHAQANLAALYQAGRGVSCDLFEAYKWYWLSEQSSNTSWSYQLRELANVMTAAETAEAERRAVAWRPTHKAILTEGEGDLLE
jgi:TPR repeat protein